MSKKPCILAIDQGTTSSRAMLFDENTNVIATVQREFPQLYPAEGWVEHDPETILGSVLAVSREALVKAREQGFTVAGIGITNQRETSIVWNRATGKAIYNAIVWQDRRTADHCDELKQANMEAEVQSRTGLLLDPYFSATKIAWILDHVDGARQQAERGELAFGTIDSFLIWHLTDGQVHVTDATNASRTNLYNIHDGEWDENLLGIYRVPRRLLPRLMDCSTHFANTDVSVFGTTIPITGVAGDQQAASIGQCCFEPGSIKSTYGTGCFVMIHSGDKPVVSRHRLLTTVAFQLDGVRSYAIEGSIFVAGAAVQWLRDGLGIIDSAAETESLAGSLQDNRGVYIVPAFTGLGAPYWRPDVRGAIFGLTRATGPAEIARATLESVAYLTGDLFAAMENDGMKPTSLRVDGGMAVNDWFLQFLADVLGMRLRRSAVMETTALGAAYLAGRHLGIYGDFEAFTALWRGGGEFEPRITESRRRDLLEGWQDAVRRATE